MSSIEWRHDGRRILIPMQVLRPEPASDLTSVTVTALLDTGANVSGVVASVARKLDLPSMGKRPLISAQGIGFAERFLFRVGLCADDARSGLPYVFPETMGFSLADGSSTEAVLGMDVLSRCRLTLDSDWGCRLDLP